MDDALDAARYRKLKSFALPRYQIRVSSGDSASLYREHDITVCANSWDELDNALDAAWEPSTGEKK